VQPTLELTHSKVILAVMQLQCSQDKWNKLSAEDSTTCKKTQTEVTIVSPNYAGLLQKTIQHEGMVAGMMSEQADEDLSGPLHEFTGCEVVVHKNYSIRTHIYKTCLNKNSARFSLLIIGLIS
jgi:hypothetical protein